MSIRIARVCVATAGGFLCGIAAAQIAPVPPAAVGLVTPQAAPTEMDKAYHYSTIGQELAYTVIREDAGKKAAGAGSGQKPQIGGGPRSSPLQTSCAASSLSSPFYPRVSSLCPLPSQLVSRLEAAGYRL